MGNKHYNDLHEHLELLDKKGLLLRITREIDKDTELHPLVRWQYRGGIAEENRKAFFF
jgi:4-hydroxy-3-polyprenylbenzoate decarboxylase